MSSKAWRDLVDTDGQPCRFLNSYWCTECGRWANRRSSKGIDRCPECGSTDNKPWRSEDIDENGIIMGRSRD
jgi:ribosomal protein L37AE/L43A